MHIMTTIEKELLRKCVLQSTNYNESLTTKVINGFPSELDDTLWGILLSWIELNNKLDQSLGDFSLRNVMDNSPSSLPVAIKIAHECLSEKDPTRKRELIKAINTPAVFE